MAGWSHWAWICWTKERHLTVVAGDYFWQTAGWLGFFKKWRYLKRNICNMSGIGLFTFFLAFYEGLYRTVVLWVSVIAYAMSFHWVVGETPWITGTVSHGTACNRSCKEWTREWLNCMEFPTKVGHRKRDQLLQKDSMRLKEELCEAKISKVAS